MCILQTDLQSTKYQWDQIVFVTSHFCLINKPSGTNFSQIYQANQHIYHLTLWWTVCNNVVKLTNLFFFTVKCNPRFLKSVLNCEKCNVHRTLPSNANKKQKFPIKVYIFEFADLSACQWCKNQIHTMLVSKAHFFYFRFSSLLLHFLKTKTITDFQKHNIL